MFRIKSKTRILDKCRKYSRCLWISVASRRYRSKRQKIVCQLSRRSRTNNSIISRIKVVVLVHSHKTNIIVTSSYPSSCSHCYVGSVYDDMHLHVAVVHIIRRQSLLFDIIPHSVQPSSSSSLPSPLYFHFHRPPPYIVLLYVIIVTLVKFIIIYNAVIGESSSCFWGLPSSVVIGVDDLQIFAELRQNILVHLNLRFTVVHYRYKTCIRSPANLPVSKAGHRSPLHAYLLAPCQHLWRFVCVFTLRCKGDLCAYVF